MAKLRPEQLSAALSKNIAPIYIVTGDEPLLIQETCDAIRAAARKAGFIERDLHHCDSHFEWTQVLASANSMSLFADKKIIELRIPSGKPSDKGKVLQEYAQTPSSDNLLLVITDKLDKDVAKTKWFTALEQQGVHIQHWSVTPENLPHWINQRLKQAGLQADGNAVDLLASRIEGNLLAAVQEIEKLKLLAPGNIISMELMASVVADSARYDLFGLSDKALQGDASAAVKTLHGLKAEGTDAIAILWALTRDIRSLVQISLTMAQGKNFEMSARQAGVWDKKQPLFKIALNRIKPAQLQQLLRKANGIDKAVKGMRDAEPWDELLDLMLNLAGVQSLNSSNEKLSLRN
ncbi:MAG: DNA polymerase III subunit delta [Pseudomonadota bacterium]